MEQLPIDTNTVNKTLDMVDESTKETRKEIDKATAKGVNKLAQLFWASPIGRKADIYIAERPYKMELELKKMQQKYDSIPVEYQVEPSSYIALKGSSELNFVLDEEHLREMFENLLISDMDGRKQSRVLPAYIEIIKQLSKDDAKILSEIKLYVNMKSPISDAQILRLKYNMKKGGFFLASNDIILISKSNSYTILPSIVIDNLLRLKLIEIDFGTYKTNSTSYEKVFQEIQKPNEILEGILKNMATLGYDKGILKITDFGKGFIDICLP